MSNLYQKFQIREQFAPLLFSQPRNQNHSIHELSSTWIWSMHVYIYMYRFIIYKLKKNVMLPIIFSSLCTMYWAQHEYGVYVFIFIHIYTYVNWKQMLCAPSYSAHWAPWLWAQHEYGKYIYIYMYIWKKNVICTIIFSSLCAMILGSTWSWNIYIYINVYME